MCFQHLVMQDTPPCHPVRARGLQFGAIVGNAILLALCLPVLAWTSYLALLALLSGRNRPPAPVELPVRFDVVVPAHDEEVGIAATVATF